MMIRHETNNDLSINGRGHINNVSLSAQPAPSTPRCLSDASLAIKNNSPAKKENCSSFVTKLIIQHNVFTNMQKLRNVLKFDLLLSKYFNMEKDIKTRFGVDSLGALEFSEK